MQKLIMAIRQDFLAGKDAPEVFSIILVFCSKHFIESERRWCLLSVLRWMTPNAVGLYYPWPRGL